MMGLRHPTKHLILISEIRAINKSRKIFCMYGFWGLDISSSKISWAYTTSPWIAYSLTLFNACVMVILD